MVALFANNAASTLQSPISPTAAALVLASGDAALFPAPLSIGDFFMLTLENLSVSPPVREIVKVTARVGANCTVVRAQEGTTALAWTAGTTVEHRLTAGTLGLISSAAAAISNSQLFLGSFATAPTQQNDGTSLVYGNLYYNTTSSQFYSYNGVLWELSAPGTPVSGGYGIYLGAFSVVPLTMNDGSPLVAGTIYYNTVSDALFEWDGSSWGDISTATTTSTTGDQNFTGDVVVAGDETIGGNLTVRGDGDFVDINVSNQTKTKILVLNGDLVVPDGDISGTALQQQFPSGMQMQFGQGTSGSNGTGSVTFAQPFSEPPQVLCCPVGPTSPIPNNCGLAYPAGITAFGFTAVTGSTSQPQRYGPVAFTYMAWGKQGGS